MTEDQKRIELLENRVRELQTAVTTVIRRFGIEHEVLEAERARLDELRFTGDPDAPTSRLMVLYSAPGRTAGTSSTSTR